VPGNEAGSSAGFPSADTDTDTDTDTDVRALALATPATLIAEWIDHCGARPPSRVVGQIAKEVGQMLGDGIPYDLVRRGLASWQGKGLHPSTLASEVHAIRTTNGKSRKQAETDDLFDAAMQRAIEADARKEAHR
jgi:hypothetical protein